MSGFNVDWRAEWARRPWWMNLLMGFCFYMAFLYMPFDMFLKPVAEDDEIWFGFAVHGWYAKLTEPLHWLIYGAGAYGFWHMRSWMWPWAAAYALQVVIAMFVWNLIDVRGGGLVAGTVAAAVFMVPCLALWRARSDFANASTTALNDG